MTHLIGMEVGDGKWYPGFYTGFYSWAVHIVKFTQLACIQLHRVRAKTFCGHDKHWSMSIYLIKVRGLTGNNLNDIAMKRWALSLHSCSKLIHDLTLMRDDLLDNPTHHKEESKARMHTDSSDRQKLQAKLSQCIEPLSPAGHSTTPVNVHNAVQLGMKFS